METATAPHPIVTQIQSTARDMAGWLKFLGIMSIISGVGTALTIIGIVIAWLPIWMGVLLMQAGNAANAGSPQDMVEMVRKFKTYFVVTGVLMLIGIVGTVIALLVSGASLFALFSQMGDM